MSHPPLTALSRLSLPREAVSSLFGPATSTGAYRNFPTGSLPARQRAALAFLRQWRKRWRVRRRQGYQRHMRNGKSRWVHRTVMEILLGRPLRRQEHVHHRDGDVTNNHPANLQLLSEGAHTVVTHAKYAVVGYCMGCGRPFYRTHRGPRRGLVCSRQCWGAVARRTRGWHNVPAWPDWTQPRLTPLRHRP